jgi:hypothetical protein
MELESTVVYYGNQSCIKLSKNPMFHDRSRHINIRYHFLKDRVHNSALALDYNPIELQISDILAKPLAKGKFEMLKEKTSVCKNNFLVKRECFHLGLL